ncbi:MAG: hypothetical protein LAO20_16735 [Acidobacteriia bacterium]|nr:hypothetical protein [Terriglobia bacterium]
MIRWWPKHPQSKQIESFFKTLHQRFDVLWGSAYCGGSIATRSEFADELLKEHQRLVKAGDADNSPLPAASDFIQTAANWIDAFNSGFKHSGRGMNGKTPQQIYDAQLPPKNRQPVNLADVAQLFWDRQKRVVSEGGCVDLFNARYQPADAESAAALMLEIKREVLVACDPLSVGEAIALTPEGKFLGNLRAQELLVHGDTPVEAIRSSLRARRQVFTATKHYLAALGNHRLLAGDVTELEALQHRGAASSIKPIIHALPVPKAVNAPAQPRLHIDDIADGYFEEP